MLGTEQARETLYDVFLSYNSADREAVETNPEEQKVRPAPRSYSYREGG
jgi:hypothetical protein